MYPHHKLDWHLSRLETRLDEAPDDTSTRLDYAEHCLSKAMFHDGGEPWYNRALTQAKRVLGADAASAGAMVIAGLALVGLERLEPATRYLDQALKEHHERADVHFALGCMYREMGDRHQALRELEIACRLAPESFETHHLLALLLWERARELGTPARLVERSQYHTTQALQLDPTPTIAQDLSWHLAMTALHTQRWNEAHKLLTVCLDSERHRTKAKYFLGLASYHLGKHKNAILFLRQHLEAFPDNPKVYARIGMSYLQLGEIAKARQACNRALAIDPSDADARWTLGCALMEEGQAEEAAQVLKELLADQPDHVPAFTELVRLRSADRDTGWIRKALRAEVSGFDRLPVHAVLEGPDGERRVTPRTATRNRVSILLQALGQADKEPIGPILGAMALTTDEALRYLLWEAALQFASIVRAKRAVAHLEQPGVRFDVEVAKEVMALTDLIPEELITAGLNVGEEDLNRAAVDRHGPAKDLAAHRKRIEAERQIARGWQALLLLGIGQRGSAHGRSLLHRWAAEADRDLVVAARAALALRGEKHATDLLRNDVRRFGAEPLVDALIAGLNPADERSTVRPLPDDTDAHCATCGRRAGEVGHLLGSTSTAVCDRCMGEIATRRRELEIDDPARACQLCGKSNTVVRAVYAYQGVCVCTECLDRSLGLVEREAVDRYFVSL
ncbi:MAG: tetratricopeptide repeat protein [Alphaproteobacteria bacterium]|nr:tetratricopeptide repeat protein [Alphaproteobacteria bacterium]